MIKASLKEIIDFLNRIDIEVTVLKIDDDTYNSNQLKIIHKILLNQESIYNNLEIDFKYKLSRRRALIVLLEEKYHDKPSYDFTDLKLYENQAKIRFKFNNSDKTKFDTPTKVHPKKPITYYNKCEDAHPKRHYIEALKLLADTSFHFFLVKEAEETIKIIYNEMLENEAKTL